MTDDLVKRLRRRTLPTDMGGLTIYDEDTMCQEAADRIEQLQAALRFYACKCLDGGCEIGDYESSICGLAARHALGEKKDG